MSGSRLGLVPGGLDDRELLLPGGEGRELELGARVLDRLLVLVVLRQGGDRQDLAVVVLGPGTGGDGRVGDVGVGRGLGRVDLEDDQKAGLGDEGFEVVGVAEGPKGAVGAKHEFSPRVRFFP